MEQEHYDDWTTESHNEFGHQNKIQPQEIVPITSLLQGADDNEAIAKGTELPSQMAIDLEDSCSDWGDVQFRNELHRLSFRRGPVRHQSTRRKPLRDRINQPQGENTLKSKRSSTSSIVQGYLERKELYWPKMYRRIIKMLSFKLWEGHLKVIEGEFGNAPVSYFVFVRFLLMANLFIFLIWFAFVCVPQITWRYGDGEHMILQPTRSQLHCLRQRNSTSNNATCPSQSVMTVYECSNQSNESFSIIINRCTNDNCESDDRPIESSTMVTVCNDSTPDAEQYCVFDNVDPEVGVLQWIVDVVTGQGYLNRTVLFYGQYFNGTINGYNLPLGYLTTTAVVYGMFLIVFIYRMAQEYNEDYIRFRHRNDFTNKLFSAWDYHITNEQVAHFKHNAMKRHFLDEIWCSLERIKKRTIKEWIIILTIRFFTNLFVFLCLAGAGAAIYFAIRLSLERTTTGLLTIETLITSVVVSCINLFLPPLFSILAELEQYKTTTGKLTVILIRSVVVRLMPIVVLVVGWLGNISCTQPSEEEGCTSDGLRVSARNRAEDCPQC